MTAVSRADQRNQLLSIGGWVGRRASGSAMTAAANLGDWRSRAACLSADPDLFFPISSSGPARDQVAKAKSICATCQVRQECLDYALATHEIHGVWGGTSEEERKLLRSQGPGTALRVHPSSSRHPPRDDPATRGGSKYTASRSGAQLEGQPPV
jgi:WhiB family transcriptional regulator, redox-sensing transcriptional regulator